MMQLVHDGYLVLHGVLVQWVRRVDELRDKHSARGLLDTPVNHTESAAGHGHRGEQEVGKPMKKLTHDYCSKKK